MKKLTLTLEPGTTLVLTYEDPELGDEFEPYPEPETEPEAEVELYTFTSRTYHFHFAGRIFETNQYNIPNKGDYRGHGCGIKVHFVGPYEDIPEEYRSMVKNTFEKSNMGVDQRLIEALAYCHKGFLARAEEGDNTFELYAPLKYLHISYKHGFNTVDDYVATVRKWEALDKAET